MTNGAIDVSESGNDCRPDRTPVRLYCL